VELTLNKSLSPSFLASFHRILLSSSTAEKQHFTNSSLGTLFLTHDIVVFICSPRSAEHNLPDSPFASPTKSAAAFAHDPFTPTESEIASPGRNAASFAGINSGGLTSHFRPSALDIPSPKPYFFPAMSRYVM